MGDILRLAYAEARDLLETVVDGNIEMPVLEGKGADYAYRLIDDLVDRCDYLLNVIESAIAARTPEPERE